MCDRTYVCPLIALCVVIINFYFSSPPLERPSLNPTKFGLTGEVVLQEMWSYKRIGLTIELSLYSKYNIWNEKCGLSREVVFQ